MDLVRDFNRGAVQLHVMHHAAQGEVHGLALIEELGRHGHRLSPGTLYPMLHRLQEAGMLACREVVVEGKRRKLYRITGFGRKAFTQCQKALRELAEEVLDDG
jgi:DNA-binding PadR family transcriptional regulator